MNPSDAAQPDADAGSNTPTVLAAGSWRQWWPWLVAGLVLLAALAWWRWSRATRATPRIATNGSAKIDEAPSVPALAEALKRGDLVMIAQALGASGSVRGDDLDAVRQRLDDAAQVAAVAQLQVARWGNGDAASALAALRDAFAQGPRWRPHRATSAPLLPPLYPER